MLSEEGACNSLEGHELRQLLPGPAPLLVPHAPVPSTLSKTSEEDAPSLSSRAFPSGPYWLAGSRGPQIHHAEPETTAL